MPVTEIGRGVSRSPRDHLEITEIASYRGQPKFGGLGVGELRELEPLREKRRKLKGLIADLTLDERILQASLRKTQENNGEPTRAAGVTQSLITYRVSRNAALLALVGATRRLPRRITMDNGIEFPSRPLDAQAWRQRALAAGPGRVLARPSWWSETGEIRRR